MNSNASQVRLNLRMSDIAFISFAAAMKVFPLSDSILLGIPHLEMNLLRQRRKDSVVRSGTNPHLVTAIVGLYVQWASEVYTSVYKWRNFFNSQ